MPGMKRSIYLVSLTILLGLFVPLRNGHAQRHGLLPDDDWTYTYIRRLQQRGHLLELHPTATPYTRDEVWRALERLDRRASLAPHERRWVQLLRTGLRPARARGPLLAASIEAGTDVVNNDRRSVLRLTDDGAPTLPVGAFRFFPAGVGTVLLEQGRLVAALRMHFDVYYRDDPDGLDAANRLITRNASYLGYDGKVASAYLGRFDTHWGVPGSTALVLSDNPVPFDRLYFRLGRGRLALRSVLGELDSITADGRFTGAAGADSVSGSERRWIAAHRFDWRPSKHVALTFMEANLFSGTSSGLSLRYLNPLFLHAFLVDEPPKNDENNGLLGGMLWLQFRRLTLQGQLLLDDFDILAESSEPPSLALTGTLHYAARALPVDVGAELSVVSARVYNTHQAEGRYVYLLRGLGTQFNDYVHARAFADVFANAWLPGLTVTAQVDHLVQGSRDLRQPYPDEEVPFILDDPTATTTRVGAAFRFQRDPRFWVRFDAGLNFVDDDVRGVRETRPTAMLSVGARLSLASAIRSSL